jgi:hypothetical protein
MATQSPNTPATPPATPSLPTKPPDASTKVADADLVSPPPFPTPAPGTPAAPKKSLLELLDEHFVQVDDLRGSSSFYPWRGYCKKCGWYTHQFNELDALDLVRKHVQQHWRDVVRFT